MLNFFILGTAVSIAFGVIFKEMYRKYKETKKEKEFREKYDAHWSPYFNGENILKHGNDGLK